MATDDRKQQAFAAELVEKTKTEGNSLFKAKDYPAAIKKYTDALRFVPSNHILFANRAMAHLKLKAYEAAAKDCTAAITLDPTFPKGAGRVGSGNSTELNSSTPFSSLTRTLGPICMLTDACSACDHPCRLCRSPPLTSWTSYLAYYRRGMARQRLGDTPGAWFDFEACVRLDPTNMDAIKRRAAVATGSWASSTADDIKMDDTADDTAVGCLRPSHTQTSPASAHGSSPLRNQGAGGAATSEVSQEGKCGVSSRFHILSSNLPSLHHSLFSSTFLAFAALSPSCLSGIATSPIWCQPPPPW